ncbi:MAG TPA: S8 family serine peptidase, partial [Mycobacterium sp.]|nr:S8 family serine peptidase [Mycobacterium sp.]
KPIAGSSFSSAFVAGVAALVRAKFPALSAHQVIHRLQATAHPPAGGRDTVTGYGVVDPVAALTWDVPPGDWLAPGMMAAPLKVPPPPPPPNPWPQRVALAGTGGAVVLVGAVIWVVTVTRRRSHR